jgi:hypothetical protein
VKREADYVLTRDNQDEIGSDVDDKIPPTNSKEAEGRYFSYLDIDTSISSIRVFGQCDLP